MAGPVHFQNPDGFNYTPVSAANPLPMGGPVAGGAAAAGNPIPVGLDFNTTPPTLTTGQRVTAQGDNRGNAKVVLMSGGSAIGALAPSATGTISAGGTVASQALCHLFKSDGTGWRADTRPSTASRIPSAAATTNATVAKAAAGDLHMITGRNASASVRYIKFCNVASGMVVGTTAVVLTYALAPASNFEIDAGGFYFSAGISYALTTGAADADTGALTAADVLGLNVTVA